MHFYDVQITTGQGETVILQVAASSPEEAEMAAINMVELGQAGVYGLQVVVSFVCWMKITQKADKASHPYPFFE